MGDSDSLVYNAVAGASAYFAVGGTNNTVTDQRSFDTDALDASLAAVDSRVGAVETALPALASDVSLAAVATNVSTLTNSNAESTKYVSDKITDVYDKSEKNYKGVNILRRLSELQGLDYAYNQYGEGSDISGELKAVLSRASMDRVTSFMYRHMQALFAPIAAGYYATSTAKSGGASDASAAELAADARSAAISLTHRGISNAGTKYDMVTDLINPVLSKEPELHNAFNNIMDNNALSMFNGYDPIYNFFDNELFETTGDHFFPLLMLTVPTVFKRYYEYLNPYSVDPSNTVYFHDENDDQIISDWSTQKLTEAFLGVFVAQEIEFNDPSFISIQKKFPALMMSTYVSAFGANIANPATWSKAKPVVDGSGVINFGGKSISDIESDPSLNAFLSDPSGQFAFIKKDLAYMLAKAAKMKPKAKVLKNLKRNIGREPTIAELDAALAVNTEYQQTIASTEYQQVLADYTTAETARSDFFTNTFKQSSDYAKLVFMSAN